MNAEFNWWLLIVGIVIGAGLIWLVLADSNRREVDVSARERAGEARWIAAGLRRDGRQVEDELVLAVLDGHASYLASPPPDDERDDAKGHGGSGAGATRREPMARPLDDPGRSDRDSA